jgi:hypothetical protein
LRSLGIDVPVYAVSSAPIERGRLTGDRVVQTALRMVIEPIFERDCAAHSYGFRPNRGCEDALRRCRNFEAECCFGRAREVKPS